MGIRPAGHTSSAIRFQLALPTDLSTRAHAGGESYAIAFLINFFGIFRFSFFCIFSYIFLHCDSLVPHFIPGPTFNGSMVSCC